MQWPTRPAGPHGAGPAMGTALIKAAVQCPCVATQTPRQAVTGRDRSGRAQHAGGRVLGTSTSGSRLGECSAAQRLTPHSRSPTAEFITNRRPAQALQKTCGKPIAALFITVPRGRSPRRPSPAKRNLALRVLAQRGAAGESITQVVQRDADAPPIEWKQQGQERTCGMTPLSRGHRGHISRVSQHGGFPAAGEVTAGGTRWVGDAAASHCSPASVLVTPVCDLVKVRRVAHRCHGCYNSARRVLKNINAHAPAGWLSGLSAASQRVDGSIPGQGTCMGCGPGPQ